ncbi:F-box DNA helicase 1 [Pelodytes ibericus]
MTQSLNSQIALITNISEFALPKLVLKIQVAPEMFGHAVFSFASDTSKLTFFCLPNFVVKKHLTETDCQELAQSREGSCSLTQPFSHRRNSRDVNHGLYPWSRSERNFRENQRSTFHTQSDRFSDPTSPQISATQRPPKSFLIGMKITKLARFHAHISESELLEFGCQNGKVRQRFQNNINPKTSSLTHVGSSSSGSIPTNVEDMDCSLSDDELFSNHMDEFSEMLNETDLPRSDPTSNRKRSLNNVRCGSPDAKIWLSGQDYNMPSTSNFTQEEDDDDDDDDELVNILDSHTDSVYGLLGVTDQKELPCEQMNLFPDELLQCIFSFLPVVDLYKSVSLVCRKWEILVKDPLFIPWKKLYHQYVGKEKRAVEHMENLLTRNRITAEDDLCVLNLIKYIATLKRSQMTDNKAVVECLMRHHLYAVAEACFIHRLQELENITENVKAWAIFALIVLLSNELHDIQSLVRCLQQSNSTMRQVEITEALYCLATLLFAMREQKILISNRIHYNVFYCLCLLENSNTPEKASLNSKPKINLRLNLTNEQQQIINHDTLPGQVVKIMAFAGTGKTSTLVKYAEKRPNVRFLYVTFNKSIAQHAGKLFPTNVTCKTFHSLAFAEIGNLYYKRKKLNPSKLTVFAINGVLPQGQAGFVRAKLVAKTLQTFFSSADEAIEIEHVPVWCTDTTGQKVLVKPEDQLFTKMQAEEIWEKMKDFVETREPAYKMTHDGYMKLWQLRGPSLSSYDVIFVDEAQDCTPSIMKVVLSQKCGKIFVGDPHQQIYTFRGAVNALCEVPHTHIFYLTKSFRFGAEIAYVGATILDACKKLRHKSLVGGNQEGTIRGHSSNKVAILSRTNSCVFDEAVKVTDGETPSKIHIIGGPENFGLNKIYDIWILFQPLAVRQTLYIGDKSIRMWAKNGGFNALKKYALSSEDKELEAKISIVEKYNIRIPDLVKRIENCHSDILFADYILGTVHKAKGLEFDTVLITDDFLKLPGARHSLERLQIPLGLSLEDEWNLLYVAVTRAKKHLIITKNIENILTLAGEYFFTAELTSQVLKDGPVVCVLQHCNNAVLENSILTMRKQPIVYNDKKEDKGGYICHSCVQQRLGPLTQLLAAPDLVNSMQFNYENLIMPRNIIQLLGAI